MKTLIIVLTGLLLVLPSATANSLTIKQPSNNTVFNPGQKVNVVVEAAPNENITAIWVLVNPKGSSGVILNSPYEIELKLDDKYVGKARIEAVARLNDDTAVETGIDITIQLPPDVKLEKIVVDKYEPMVKAPAGKTRETERLQVAGLFSDSVERDLNILEGVQYTSSDSNVATVDNKGVVTAVNLGKATISIVAGDKSETVTIKVYVIIKLDHELMVKPTDTGLQLDWKLSPQDPEWVTGYYVFRTEDPDGIIKKKIAGLPNGVTSYVDTNVEKGKTYYYVVQAVSSTANVKSDMTTLTPGILMSK